MEHTYCLKALPIAYLTGLLYLRLKCSHLQNHQKSDLLAYWPYDFLSEIGYRHSSGKSAPVRLKSTINSQLRIKNFVISGLNFAKRVAELRGRKAINHTLFLLNWCGKIPGFFRPFNNFRGTFPCALSHVNDKLTQLSQKQSGPAALNGVAWSILTPFDVKK